MPRERPKEIAKRQKKKPKKQQNKMKVYCRTILFFFFNSISFYFILFYFLSFVFLSFVVVVVAVSWAAPVAYGGSQARG